MNPKRNKHVNEFDAWVRERVSPAERLALIACGAYKDAVKSYIGGAEIVIVHRNSKVDLHIITEDK